MHPLFFLVDGDNDMVPPVMGGTSFYCIMIIHANMDVVEGKRRHKDNGNSDSNAVIATFVPVTVDEFENEKHYYIKLNDEEAARISGAMNQVPAIAKAVKDRQLADGLFKVHYDQSLGDLQKSAVHTGWNRGAIVQKGTNNKITGSAEWEKIHVKPDLAYGIFTVLSVVTNQYFLADISKSMYALNESIEGIREFLEDDKKSELWADMQTILSYERDRNVIINNPNLKQAAIADCMGIKKHALAGIDFYGKRVKKFRVETKEKDSGVVSDKISRFLSDVKLLALCIALYNSACFYIVYFSEETNPQYLASVRADMQTAVDQFDTSYVQKVIDVISYTKALQNDHVIANLAIPAKIADIATDIGVSYAFKIFFHVPGDGVFAEIQKSAQESDERKKKKMKCKRSIEPVYEN